MVATSIIVATLLAKLFSKIDVATSFLHPFYCILHHNLSSWLRPCFACHHFSSELGLLFLVALYVATSVLGGDHISISTALTLGRDFLFLVATWIFYFSVFLQVATSFIGFLHSHVLNRSCDLNNWSRSLLIFLAFLLVTTSTLSCNQFLHSTLYFRSRPQDDVETSWLLCFWLHLVPVA